MPVVIRAFSVNYSGYGTEANRPVAGTQVGQHYYASDTKRDFMWDGTGWIIMDEPWTTYVPTRTDLNGGTVVAQYKRRGGNCLVSFTWTYTAGATIGSVPQFSLPFPILTALNVTTCVWQVLYYDSAGARRYGSTYPTGNNLFFLCWIPGAANYINGGVMATAVPFTWKANDWLTTFGEYPMASKYS